MRFFTLLLVSGLLCLNNSFADQRNTPELSPRFKDCYDHGNNGQPPTNAKTYYKILKPNRWSPYPSLKAIPKWVGSDDKTFHLIVEDVRFTSYKCWDKFGNLTGFDVELLTQAAHESGFQYINFVPRAWTSYDIGGEKYLSLLIDLITGWGDALSAGMSMTPQRQELVHMIGPIYKAGKKLMARKDNKNITPDKLQAMLQVPTDGYEALRGLSVVVQNSSIRGEFFRRLNNAHPDLVEFLNPIAKNQKINNGKLSVLEVENFDTINEFIDSGMTRTIQGILFDLVMIDTGSAKTLIEEGKLGQSTHVVTGNLGADRTIGDVFGIGDGVSLVKGNPLIAPLTGSIASMIREGRVNKMVEKWFADENAADHSWANQ